MTMSILQACFEAQIKKIHMKWLAHTWYIVLVNKNWLNRERAMLVY